MPASSLRPFQIQALARLERAGHVVCVAPTGSGKSRIYEEIVARQAPRTLLFSPLVALARQQERALEDRGIAVFGPGAERARPLGRESGVWSLRPESLLHAPTRSRLAAWRPEFLVVDECHCCWDWGESFRPAFRQLLELSRELQIPRTLWLTATLPAEARALLEARLPEPREFLGEFDLPPGLFLRVLSVAPSDRLDALLRWLEREPEPGIVFVATRQMAERVARGLCAAGRPAWAYHAGLSVEERRAIEARLRVAGQEVVIATSAFGMGMHFPRLRWVVLWQAPASLLGLAQAIGRVGRGEEGQERGSRAMIFWDEDDFRLIEWMVQGSATRARELAGVRAYLAETGCRVNGLRRAFGAAVKDLACESCDRCVPEKITDSSPK